MPPPQPRHFQNQRIWQQPGPRPPDDHFQDSPNSGRVRNLPFRGDFAFLSPPTSTAAAARRNTSS
ncbi:hypothetical protein B0H19DRAFT_1170148, partial [Mycena capillaripes]